MQQENKIIIAILLGAVIIGLFIFAGTVYKSTAQQVVVENSNAAVIKESVLDKNYAVAPKMPPVAPVASCGAQTNTVVTKVIDGDTLVVEGGYHVRLLGIDADEKNYPCYAAAKTRLEALALGKQVKLEKDVTDVDQYGRCLRTIFLGNQNIDLQLVKEGLVVARFYLPDVKYKSEITAAEKEAIAGKAGCKWTDTK